MSDTKDFLLEEYRALTQALHFSEETGEKRMNFFYTLTSAVFGATVLFLTNMPSTSNVTGEINNGRVYELHIAEVVVVIFFLGLLAVGFIIQRRLQKRNATTDGYIQDLKRIRKIFKEANGDVESLPGNYSSFEPHGLRSRERKFSSLVDIARVMNIFIIGITLTITTFFVVRNTSLSLVLGFLAMFVATLFFYRKAIFQKSSTHAGGVLYRKDDTIKFLVIKSSSNEDWVLPKGHIESGETSRLAAIREVMEETGFLGRIITSLKRMDYSIGKKSIRADFFLMEVAKPEPREQRWVSVEEAQEILHPQSVNLLRDAQQALIEGHV